MTQVFSVTIINNLEALNQSLVIQRKKCLTCSQLPLGIFECLGGGVLNLSDVCVWGGLQFSEVLTHVGWHFGIFSSTFPGRILSFCLLLVTIFSSFYLWPPEMLRVQYMIILTWQQKHRITKLPAICPKFLCYVQDSMLYFPAQFQMICFVVKELLARGY